MEGIGAVNTAQHLITNFDITVFAQIKNSSLSFCTFDFEPFRFRNLLTVMSGYWSAIKHGVQTALGKSKYSGIYSKQQNSAV